MVKQDMEYLISMYTYLQVTANTNGNVNFTKEFPKYFQ